MPSIHPYDGYIIYFDAPNLSSTAACPDDEIMYSWVPDCVNDCDDGTVSEGQTLQWIAYGPEIERLFNQRQIVLKDTILIK
jgi:hypothetical protein